MTTNRDPSFGLINNDLLYCCNFPCIHLDQHSRYVSSYKCVPNKPFILEMYHNKCQQSWFSCTLCPAVRTQFTSIKLMKHHIISPSHRNKALAHANVAVDIPPTLDHVLVNNADFEYYVPNNDLPENRPDVLAIHPVDSSIAAMFPYCSPTQTSYFYNEYQNNDPLGYLVSKAIFHNGLMKNELSDLDIELHMSLATLCISLSKEQKFKLSRFLHIINDMLIQKNCTLFSEKRIPTSYNEMCNTYINGSDSILKNIPRPDQTTIGKHSYTSLLQCVADVMGHVQSNVAVIDQHSTVPQRVSSPIHSPRAIEIASRARSIYQSRFSYGYCLFIYEWSDGFEPTSSSKNNRGGAWVKTITIASNGLADEKENTYAIAFGPSSESHEDIEQLFAEELRQLRSGTLEFYHGNSKKK